MGDPTADLAARTTQEVYEDHLRLADENDIEGDLARNVAEDVVVLTGRGVFRGHDGVRELARQLMTEIPSGRWTYVTRLFEGPMALSGTARTPTSSRTARSACRPSTTPSRTTAAAC